MIVGCELMVAEMSEALNESLIATHSTLLRAGCCRIPRNDNLDVVGWGEGLFRLVDRS